MRIATILLVCLAGLVPDAAATKAAVSAEVAAASWKTVRLRGLVQGGSLAIRVQSTGPIGVFLIHERELGRLPQPVEPLFAGSLERLLSFKVSLPLAGAYYLVLDNRKGAESRSIKLAIEALPPVPRRAPARPGDREMRTAI